MFENSLIESTHHDDKNKKAISLPVSIFIHAAVIGGILGASIWFVGEVPEPPIPVTFYAAAPPSATTALHCAEKLSLSSRSSPRFWELRIVWL